MNFNDPVAVGRLTDSDSSAHMDATVQSSAAPSLTAAPLAASKDCVYTFSDNCDSDDGEELKFKIKNILQTPLKDATVAAAATTNTTASATADQTSESLRCRATTDDDDRMVTDNFSEYTPPTAAVAPFHDADRPMLRPDPNDAGHHRSLSPSIASAAPAGQQPKPTVGCESSQTQQSLIHSPPAELMAAGSPSSSTLKSPATAATATPIPLTPPVRRPTNGCIPKTGKPLTFASNAAAAATAAAGSAEKRPPRVRARPNRKALVTMYQSQISDNTLGGIKLKLKKSSDMATAVSQAADAVAATITGRGATGGAKPRVRSRPTGAAGSTARNNRKRAARRTARDSSDGEDGDGRAEKRVRKPAASKAARQPKSAASASAAAASSNVHAAAAADQTDWGARLPEPVLYQIFGEVVRQEGSLPSLVRLGKVCNLWQRVSLDLRLWQTLDLSRWTKEKFRTELRLKWLIENRGACCVEMNVSNWKITNVNCVLTLMAETCPKLESVTFSGWKSFTSDDLLLMAEQLSSLRRIDLSSINIEASHKSAVSIQALCLAIQLMKGRLTHLHLSNNKLAGIPQIVTALATFCPNLELLDLSNVSTVANSHGVLHLEKLQSGCTKLRVLRITNSHITLGPATLEEQMSSPGFPELEELSIAALSDESRLINDDYLQRILKTSTKLQLLDVRGCARLTHESMIRLPTWDLKHLFLSGCAVTRDLGSGLELIASKWAHSLIEFDLAWANVQHTIDNALQVIAEKGPEAAMSHLNLCGSSVSQEAVKEILLHCPQLSSINLSSCRGLPRGVKRLMQGTAELNDLREALGVPLPMPPPPPTNSSSSSSSSSSISSTPPTTTTTTAEHSLTPSSSSPSNINNNNSSNSSNNATATATAENT